jgi:hypothetical protein
MTSFLIGLDVQRYHNIQILLGFYIYNKSVCGNLFIYLFTKFL